MTPIQLLDTAVRALHQAEDRNLSYQAAALTAIAWAVCAWVAWTIQGKGEA
jgi:hypothetical protein